MSRRVNSKGDDDRLLLRTRLMKMALSTLPFTAKFSFEVLCSKEHRILYFTPCFDAKYKTIMDQSTQFSHYSQMRVSTLRLKQL